MGPCFGLRLRGGSVAPLHAANARASRSAANADAVVRLLTLRARLLEVAKGAARPGASPLARLPPPLLASLVAPRVWADAARIAEGAPL